MERIILGVVIGGAAGLAWHRLVGCRTGACPIWANPYMSTLYGAFIGMMLYWR